MTAVLFGVVGGAAAQDTAASDAASSRAQAARQALLSRELFDIKKSGKEKILCAVVDLHTGAGVATLASHNNGTVDLYFADGNAMTDLDRMKGVHVAGSQFFKRAKSERDRLEPATEFPEPGIGQMTFYLITSKATLSSGLLDQVALASEEHPLHELARKADVLLTQIRLSQRR